MHPFAIAKLVQRRFNNTYKQPVETSVSSASELDGTWRELLSTHTRGFDGQGSTWIEGAQHFGQLDANRQQGSYRFLETGKIEIHMGTFRAIRGSSWNNRATNYRTAFRTGTDPTYTSRRNGFRIAVSPSLK